MAAWSGMGLNYKSIAHAASDITYFKKIGVNKVRIHIPFYTATQQIADWRPVAKQFYDAGFYVIWGISGNALTSANWAALRTGVLAEATYLAGQPKQCSEFQVGNEYEYNHDGTISSATLRSNIRTLATDTQAILTNCLISYTTPQDQILGWITEGKGDLDILGHNIYGEIQSQGGASWKRTYASYLSSAVARFGTALSITEFNIDSFTNNLTQYSDEEYARYLREEYSYIRSLGIGSAYFYQYRGYKDTDNQFAVALNSGGFLPAWDGMSNDNKRRTFI